MRRVQAVIWNRCLMRTASGRLGLVRQDVKPGYLICILYGCTVPVILKRCEKTDEDLLEEREEDKEAEKEEAVIVIQRGYRAIRERRSQRMQRRLEQRERNQKQAEDRRKHRRELKQSIFQWQHPRVAYQYEKTRLSHSCQRLRTRLRVDLFLISRRIQRQVKRASVFYRYYAAASVPTFAVLLILSETLGYHAGLITTAILHRRLYSDEYTIAKSQLGSPSELVGSAFQVEDQRALLL